MKNSAIPLRSWLPLLGMTISVFIFNTSEFMPIGLLTDIAAAFNITEAHAGMMISAYAWTVTILSLPLMLLVCRIKFRKLLLLTVALFCIGQILSGVSQGYRMLVLSRICVACAHSIFWSVAAPIAVQLVSKEHQDLALSMIVTGTSIAMIVGLPLGRVVGLYIGWRMTFFVLAGISFIVLVYLFTVFPQLPDISTFSFHQLPQLLKKNVLTETYFLTFLVATAYYTGYSYIEPFLRQIAAFPEGWITITLTIFGASGLIGSFLFSICYNRVRYGFIRVILACITISLLLLYPVSAYASMVIVLCALWGMAVTAFNVTFQAEIIQSASLNAAAVAMSIFSGIFNLGIGSGTWLGGIVSTYSSIAYIGYAGGAVAFIAFLYCVMILIKQLQIAE